MSPLSHWNATYLFYTRADSATLLDQNTLIEYNRPVHAATLEGIPDGVRASRGVNYYRDGLGFGLVFEMDGVASFDAGGVSILLHAVATEELPAPLICFEPEDLEAKFGELSERGIRLPPITDEGWGRLTRFADLDGNRLCLQREHAAQ